MRKDRLNLPGKAGIKMDSFINVEKLRPEVRKSLEPYLRTLLVVAKEEILSIVLFGSATGPDFIPGRSDLNLALLVREITPAFLKKCLEPVKTGFKKGIVAPLLLTREYIGGSLDVFPVEFLDIRETGLVLFGEDPFSGIELSGASLRLESEQQLKGTVLRIRQAYLEIGLATAGIDKVLSQSLNSLVPVFRAMLALRGLKPPRNKRDIVTLVCKTFEISEAVFLDILKLKMQTGRVSPEAEEKILGEYMRSIERLAGALDKLEVDRKI